MQLGGEGTAWIRAEWTHTALLWPCTDVRTPVPALQPSLLPQHGMQQQVVLRRAGVARIYVTRGTFLVDALSSAAWFAQVG